ncbi:MAG: hypothetical protein IJ071_03880 [Ruminococcus sp.]|nr:hypothetical protein [Ruminococcus sp.]
MDKKIFAAALAAILTGALTACSGVRSASEESSEATAPTEAVTEEATEPETAPPTEAETEAPAATEAPTEAATQPETYPPEEAPAQSLFPADDAALIAKAQEMFELACTTEWDFTLGLRYTVDPETYYENQYSWRMYLITDPGINSMEDIRNDYHTVFSSSRPDGLDEIFAEIGGRAYALSGGRGSNIFYESSEVTEIQSRTDTEAVFTVVHHMNGSDFGDDPVDETDTFSLVIEDGAIKVDQFRLPY